jgi:hypothetical protein
MIPNTSIHKIFVLGNSDREPDQIQYLNSYFQKNSVAEFVEYFQPTYKNSIPNDLQDLYFSAPSELLGRPLKNSEISLFLNFLLLFEKLLAEYSDGYFLIFESDVLFESPILEYLTYMEQIIQLNPPDCFSIGSGCDMIHDNVNTDDMNFQLFPTSRVRCTDSFLFSYDGIRAFVDYLYAFQKRKGSIDQPIDNFFKTFLEANPAYVQLWVWPSLTHQGSQYGVYASSIQNDTS